MKTKVRIAPTEQWCKFHAKHLSDARKRAICLSIVGLQVEIETSTMRNSVTPECLGRIWSETEATRKLLQSKGCSPDGNGICEHMLEMD